MASDWGLQDLTKKGSPQVNFERTEKIVGMSLRQEGYINGEKRTS
jgi:hypothetical protein